MRRERQGAEIAYAAGRHREMNSNFVLLGDPDHVPYGPLIGTDVGGRMSGSTGAICLRIPFMATGVANAESLILNIRYDDGFVAYPNGTEVARRNAPMMPGPDSTASTGRSDRVAANEERIDLTGYRFSVAGRLECTGHPGPESVVCR